jgi:hypothetical protein
MIKLQLTPREGANGTFAVLPITAASFNSRSAMERIASPISVIHRGSGAEMLYMREYASGQTPALLYRKRNSYFEHYSRCEELWKGFLSFEQA